MQIAPQAFATLKTAGFAPCIESPVEDVDFDFGFSVKPRQTQKDKKKARRNRAPTIDRAPFEKLGFIVSENKLEAEEVTEVILDDLRAVLVVSSRLFGAARVQLNRCITVLPREFTTTES